VGWKTLLGWSLPETLSSFSATDKEKCTTVTPHVIIPHWHLISSGLQHIVLCLLEYDLEQIKIHAREMVPDGCGTTAP
jgi:hypothetical protein